GAAGGAAGSAAGSAAGGPEAGEAGGEQAGPRRAVAVTGARLDGAEAFVNALLLHGEELYVATARGLVRVSADTGTRRGLVLAGKAVTSLAPAPDGLVAAGTSDGLWLVEGGAAWKAPGSPVGPVTAVAVRDRIIYAGTARGVFEVPVASRSASSVPVRSRAARTAAAALRWFPLVVGPAPAGSAVVTALAAADAGGEVWAGTDDAGLVRLATAPAGAGAPPRSAGFLPAAPRAALVSPGAALAFHGALLFGTQGGGLLRAAPGGAGPALARYAAAGLDDVTALGRTADGALLAATADGTVFWFLEI
ncbi:MAG TPA: hypothetical protein VG389_27355, partial [Myxococcota bacterium]|nr:hypothetical protein [Myxococcota bacterium]